MKIHFFEKPISTSSLIVILLNPFFLFASDEAIEKFVQKKLGETYPEYEIKCLAKADPDACRDLDFTSLTYLFSKSKKTPPEWPKSELNPFQGAYKNAWVVLFLDVDEEGKVEYLETTGAKCGYGDTYVQKDWVSDDCDVFIDAAKKSIRNWSYEPVLIKGKAIRRMIENKFAFKMEGSSSEITKTQFLDLESREIRKLRKILKKQNHEEIVTYAKQKALEHPIYLYHLGVSLDKLGKTEEAISSYKKFLEQSENKYFYYGSDAKMILINHLYRQGEYSQVLDIYDDQYASYISANRGPDAYIVSYLLAASSTLIAGDEIEALSMFLKIRDEFAELVKSDSSRKVLIENSNASIKSIIGS